MASNEAASTAVVQRTPQQDLVEWVSSDDRIAQIEQSLPEGVSLSRFTRATRTALMANPDLAKADRASLYIALLNAAQRGLVPDGKQGAIVMYGKTAQFLPMIGGVRDTLAEYGWMLKTGTVREHDEFEFDEAAGTVKHPLRVGSDRGEIIGFYAVASQASRRMGTYMSVAEVNDVRDKAGVANNPAWKKWYEQMGQKTVGHRLADDVPLAPQDRRRIEWILNATEIGPEESAAALYGPAARASFGELPAGEEFEEAETTEPATTSEPDASFDGEGHGADEFGEEPEPVATDGDTTTDEDVAAAETAAGFEVKIRAESWVNGLTVAEVNARGDEGQAFFRWSLGPKNKNAELRAAVAAFAKVQLPFLHGELVGEES